MPYAQFIILALAFAQLGLSLGMDGKPKEGADSMHCFGRQLINEATIAGLLYWGGFFDCLLKR